VDVVYDEDVAELLDPLQAFGVLLVDLEDGEGVSHGLGVRRLAEVAVDDADGGEVDGFGVHDYQLMVVV